MALSGCGIFGGSTREESTEHKHVYENWTIHRAPTCVKEGIEIGECACGEKKTRTVPATGHTPVVDEAYEPTCVQEGKKQGSHCSECGVVIKAQESIPATGRHIYGDDGKCVMCGEERPCTYGLTFTLNKKGTEYTVTAFDGTYDEIVVPAEYDYIPVTEIAASVFEGRSNIKSIVISEGVKRIQEYAFQNCTSLETIVIPSSVETINSYTLAGCSSLKEMTIPFVGYEVINGDYDDYQYPLGVFFGISPFEGAEATEQRFYYKKPKNYDLESEYKRRTYYVPKSLTKVTVTKGTPTGGAFMNCKNITEINLPEGITSIKTYAFYGCSGIRSFVLPDTVTEVQMKAFENCSNLTRLTLGKGMGKYSIMEDKDVFKGCYKLVEICNLGKMELTPGSTKYSYLTYYAKNIVRNASSTKLTEVSGCPAYVDGDEVVLLGRYEESESFVVPSGITAINDYAFCNDKTLHSVSIPANVKRIGKNAFSGCENLSEAVFSASGWKVFLSEEDTGTDVETDSAQDSAENLINTYKDMIWKREE